MLSMILADIMALPDSVLAYEELNNAHDAANPFVIIQYTMTTVYKAELIGQFQIYLFKNGDIGYIYNNVYDGFGAQGGFAIIGEP